MIRLNWLKMKAFRSFADETYIEFPRSGLVLIRGANQTSHDSSGSGKSTILLAIAYAFDMCPFSASELQSWHTDEPMQVQVGLTSPLGEVVITRGKRNSLKIADQPAITGAKAISEQLRKLFGLDPETLQAITYRPQNTPGLFLTLTDAEKKDFLTKILGLDAIERAVAAAEEQVKAIAPAVASEEAAIAQLEQELANLQAQSFPEPQDIGELLQELEVRNYELTMIDQRLKTLYDDVAQKKATAMQDPELVKLKELIEVCTLQSESAKKANQDRLREFQTNQENLRRRLQDITRHEANRVNISNTISKLHQDLKHAEEGACPTCRRTWDEAKAKAEEYRASIANFEAQLQTLGSFTAERQKVETALRETFVMDPVIEQLRAVKEDLESQYRQLKADLLSAPDYEAREGAQALQVQRASTSTRVQALGEQVRTIQAMNAKLDTGRKQREASLSAVVGRIEGRRKIVAKLQADLNAEKDFLALMGRDGFLGVIFDDVLQEIEIEANERLGRLANVSHVTIQFKSEVETQKGTVQKKITPVVSINGVEAKLKSGLSGGMYTSVEGVVDLAVMSVVQRRTGTIPGFLFLDESFNGQGNATKEAAMEVLREYGEEKLVVVIDHNSEFKEMFTQFIDVDCKDGKSSVA